jgi:hypothetical protein
VHIPVTKEEILEEKKYIHIEISSDLSEGVYKTESEYKMESPYRQKRQR